LRTPDLSQQSILGIKEIPRKGSCTPVESHHCQHLRFIISFQKPNLYSLHVICNALQKVERF